MQFHVHCPQAIRWVSPERASEMDRLVPFTGSMGQLNVPSRQLTWKCTRCRLTTFLLETAFFALLHSTSRPAPHEKVHGLPFPLLVVDKNKQLLVWKNPFQISRGQVGKTAPAAFGLGH